MLEVDVRMTHKEREEYNNFCECHRLCVCKTSDRDKITLQTTETGIGSRFLPDIQGRKFYCNALCEANVDSL